MTKPKKNKGGRPREWTPAKLEKLGKELLDYCKRPDVWHVSKFEVEEKNKSPGWLKGLAKDYDEFSPILEGARHLLANKLAQTAMEGNGNNWIIGKFIPMYLREVDDFDEGKKDKEHKRALDKEKYKYELGAAKHEEASAKIDAFDKATGLAMENKRLREEIERLKGE